MLRKLMWCLDDWSFRWRLFWFERRLARMAKRVDRLFTTPREPVCVDEVEEPPMVATVGERPTRYYMTTYRCNNGYGNAAIAGVHPADWLIGENGREHITGVEYKVLLWGIELTKEQYDRFVACEKTAMARIQRTEALLVKQQQQAKLRKGPPPIPVQATDGKKVDPSKLN